MDVKREVVIGCISRSPRPVIRLRRRRGEDGLDRARSCGRRLELGDVPPAFDERGAALALAVHSLLGSARALGGISNCFLRVLSLKGLLPGTFH